MESVRVHANLFRQTKLFPPASVVLVFLGTTCKLANTNHAKNTSRRASLLQHHNRIYAFKAALRHRFKSN